MWMILFTVIKRAHRSGFLEYNSIVQCIQFTVEATRADGFMPFLNTLVIPQPDDSLDTTAYRNPAHIDQYLHWDSHCTISAKYSVISSLYRRARAVYSNPLFLQKEEHLQEVMSKYKCPIWILNRIKIKETEPEPFLSTNSTDANASENQRLHMVVPYTKDLNENL